MKAVESLTNYMEHCARVTGNDPNPKMHILCGLQSEIRNNKDEHDYMVLYSAHIDPDHTQGVWNVAAVESLLHQKKDIVPCFVHFNEAVTKDGSKNYFNVITAPMTKECLESLPAFVIEAIHQCEEDAEETFKPQLKRRRV